MSSLKNSQQKIEPCLWFTDNILEAVNFYTSLFKDSEILNVTHYGKNSHMPEGTVLTVSFKLEGQKFLALNGGPAFTFNQAISFMVNCDTQEEIDFFWEKLSEGGQIQQCGWLKDKFGLSWQIVPSILDELMSGDPEKFERVMQAVMQMIKLDIQIMKNAYDGK